MNNKTNPMNENILKTKSFLFAVRIVKLYNLLRETKQEYVMSKQCLRSGTSVGAMIREAEYAASKADFIHKLTIAIKECNEALYWLELLQETEFIEKKLYVSLNTDAEEILKLLTASIKTAKKNI